MNPTNRTIQHLHSRGCLADVVERRITKILTKDWLGFADIIAASEHGPIAVQATSSSNFAARMKKLRSHEETISKLIAWGWAIELYGWDHREEPRIWVWS